ncbi:MAG: hypothetical protein ACRDPK_15645 [Carbonactinosporaceae bacterium]
MRRLVPARPERRRPGVRFGVVLVVTALVSGALGPSPAAAAGNGWPVNLAIAINAGADQRVTDLAWGVSRTGRTPAFERNLALARSTGRDLTTAAAAFQIVLAGRAIGPVDAANQARATNRNCPGCDTVAVAYQFVVVSDERVGLSREARARLARLRHSLAAALRSSAGGREIVDRAGALASDVRQVLRTGLVERAAGRRTLAGPLDRRPPDDRPVVSVARSVTRPRS